MSTTSNTSNGKRKRASPPSFYAVKTGRVPGIYQSWDDSKKQTDGFTNAVHQKFDTHAKAEAWLKGSSSPAVDAGKATKFFGVAVGRVPGVYTDWASVQAQITGYPSQSQKRFGTRAEAQAFVDQVRRGSSAPISLRGDLSDASSLAAGKVGDSAIKSQKEENQLPASALTNGNIKFEPGMGPLPPNAEDGFDRTIKLDLESGNIRIKTEEELVATKIQPTGHFSGPIVVYTDGSSLGNGTIGAVGGVGVYFGPNHPKNISEALRGEKQTNQRAELTAVARALDHIPIDRDALIVTDSNYSIKCLAEWFVKWEKNGWRNSVGHIVENKDLIEPILARIREREMSRAKTNFKWIKGHASDPGNVAADSLAVQGSRSSTPQFRNSRETSKTLNTPTRTHYFNALKTEPKAELERKSEPRAIFREDDDEDFDQLFAELAAEPMSQVIGAALAQDSILPSVAAEQLAKAGAHESQDRLEQILNEDLPESKVNLADRMDIVPE